MVPLFATVIGLSALLLFWVQPMFARMALPLLGGSPGVWNTALVFFQGALLAGYGYAHLASRLPLRAQAGLHALVLALAAAALPIAVPEGWSPPAEGAPTFWLLALLAVAAGPPFFALSATAPLLQAWFARTGHKDAKDPYFLYAASNAGSLAALLGYPLLMEPLLGLTDQSRAWSLGYAMLAPLLLFCGLLAARRQTAGVMAAAPDNAPAPGWRDRLWWIALAFAPSSLLLGVTQHITTDIAAIPLFWVAPLSLYLATFILAFARGSYAAHPWVLKAQALAALLLAFTFFWPIKSLGLVFTLHLGAFFLTALACHGELARRRPGPRRVTEFYLWLSLGGVLGGAFNALAAPLLFSSVVEYPLMLAAACLLRRRLVEGGRTARVLDVALPALLALALWPRFDLFALGLAAVVAYHVAVGLFAYSMTGRPLRFALAVGALLATAGLGGRAERDLLHEARSFFGVHRVLQDGKTGHLILMHGTTIHGVQSPDPARVTEPIAYFTREGPLGQAFAALADEGWPRRVGLVGLGAGSIVCYARPGQTWRLFEIDPLVAEIARAGRFRFLPDCAPEAPVILGDARLTLAREPAGSFDLLILDAFSSDSVPVHLLTREAFQLYLSKLAPGGVILMQISNWHLDLEPAVARLAADAGLTARVQNYSPPDPAKAILEYRFPTTWTAFAHAEADLGGLARDPRWRAPAAGPGGAIWTDDYANLLAALRWSKAKDAL